MPYIPTPEKLATLSPETRARLEVVSGQVGLSFDIGRGATTVYFECPTELFFDQLLVSLGWETND